MPTLYGNQHHAARILPKRHWQKCKVHFFKALMYIPLFFKGCFNSADGRFTTSSEFIAEKCCLPKGACLRLQRCQELKTQRVRMGLQLLLIMRLWILSVVDMTVCGASVLEILGD